ncbi:MAG: hypothetical protein RR246_00995 [Clostridia bacterium]
MLNRKFTTNEKRMLTLLSIILLVALYKLVVFDYISNSIDAANAEFEIADTEYNVEIVKAAKIKKMQKEIDDLKQSHETTKKIPTYDNINGITVFFNEVFKTDDTLSFGFTEPTTNGDGYFRRTANISFKASSYQAAKEKIKMLQQCQYSSTVDSIAFATDEKGDIASTEVSVSVMMTFIETTK